MEYDDDTNMDGDEGDDGEDVPQTKIVLVGENALERTLTYNISISLYLSIRLIFFHSKKMQNHNISACTVSMSTVCHHLPSKCVHALRMRHLDGNLIYLFL